MKEFKLTHNVQTVTKGINLQVTTTETPAATTSTREL